MHKKHVGKSVSIFLCPSKKEAPAALNEVTAIMRRLVQGLLGIGNERVAYADSPAAGASLRRRRRLCAACGTIVLGFIGSQSTPRWSPRSTESAARGGNVSRCHLVRT